MSLVKTELKAKDVMTSDPVCVTPSTGISELSRIFEDQEISGAPVVDQAGRVIGIVSKTDLIRRCAAGTGEVPPAFLYDLLNEQREESLVSELSGEPDIRVEDFMTEDPLMVGPEVSVAMIAQMMHEKRIHRVIVTDDDGMPLGVITSMDLLGAVARF